MARKEKKGLQVSEQKTKKTRYNKASSHCTIAGRYVGFALWITMAHHHRYLSWMVIYN